MDYQNVTKAHLVVKLVVAVTGVVPYRKPSVVMTTNIAVLKISNAPMKVKTLYMVFTPLNIWGT